MAGDQPLLAVPLIREGVARLDDTAVAEGEGVETGIDGGVAVDLDASPVDDTNRLALQKMLEVVLLLRGADPRLVGDRRQREKQECRKDHQMDCPLHWGASGFVETFGCG